MAISSNLDLANQALALLGEMSITALNDTSSKAAIYSNTFVDQAILETLAQHDWREAIKRATITAGSAPNYGATATFAIPAGCLRVLEVNASTSADSSLPFHIEGATIVATASTIYLRYIDTIAISACGPLLQQACAARLATKLALPLTGDQERMATMEALFSKTLSEAKAKDATEHPLVRLVLERLGVAPDNLSPDLLRRIRTFADDARKEVLRMTYTNESTALSSMDTLAVDAVHIRHATKVATALSLPSAAEFEKLFQLRIREARVRALQTSVLNGRVLAMIGNDFATKELSDLMLADFATMATEAKNEVCRSIYISEATALGSMDTLAQECVDINHARKIATFLDLPTAANLEALYTKKLQEAKARALQTSALNGRVLAMIGADLVTRDLSDTTITELATFADDARKEVCRSIYISEATALGSMDTLAQECVDINHARKIATFLSLPSLAEFETLYTKKLQEAKARALQTSALNGRVLAMIGADLVTKDISDTMLTELVTNLAEDARKEICRKTYISESTVIGSMDTLAQAAVDALHAAKIAHYLSLPSLADLEGLADKRLQEARVRALQTSALNGRVLAMIGNDLATKELSDTTLADFVTMGTEAKEEILRTGLFSSSLKTTRLTTSLGTLGGKAYSYAIPSDSVAVVEVSSDAAGNTLLDYEIFQNALAVDTAQPYIRYASDDITHLDPLVLEAIDARHAAKIAAFLNLPSLANLQEIADRRMFDARKASLHESDLSIQVLSLVGDDLAKGELSRHQLRWFRAFGDEARQEVLRMTYQSESTALSAMDSLSQAAQAARHAQKIAANRSLPSATTFEELFQRRIQEAKARILQTSALNGRVLAMIQADLITKDISDTTLTELLTFAEDARKEVNRLTYVSEATVLASMDTLAQECVDILTARKVAAFFALPSLPTFEQLFSQKLQEAKARALQTSALNGRVLAMIGNDLVTRDLSTTTLAELVDLGTDARLEVLRAHRWNCATVRDDLTSTQAAAVDSSYPYTYDIPTGCLRILEVNGEAYEAGENRFEVEGELLYAHASTCWIRYIDSISLANCDPLVQSAIDALHAAKIAAFLALPSVLSYEDLYRKRLGIARQANSHPRAADNNPQRRAHARSSLLSSRGYRRDPLRRDY